MTVPYCGFPKSRPIPWAAALGAGRRSTWDGVPVGQVSNLPAPGKSQKKKKKMITNLKSAEPQSISISLRAKLSALWAALMFLYIYADIFSLYKPGQVQEAMAGRMGFLPVTQGSLLAASLLMLVPALMVFLSTALKPEVDRWANIVLGLLYTAINVGNLVGETWAFYILFSAVEMALTLLIVAHAWTWRNPEKQP